MSKPQNRLLGALPDEAYERLYPHLENVSLLLGQVIYESGERLDHIYFPTTSIVSLLYTMEDGTSAEIGVVGNDGVVGIALFMGGETTPNRAVVQSAGYSLRMMPNVLQEEFRRGGPLQLVLLRYTQALITQMSQTAVCNRLHTVDQQLCRWLLLSHDRLDSNELTMTQELIANMLGVRREGVTVAAGHLQAAGLIRYNRGKITISDRAGLEARACECYQVVRNEFERLLRVTESFFAAPSATPFVQSVELCISAESCVGPHTHSFALSTLWLTGTLSSRPQGICHRKV